MSDYDGSDYGHDSCDGIYNESSCYNSDLEEIRADYGRRYQDNIDSENYGEGYSSESNSMISSEEEEEGSDDSYHLKDLENFFLNVQRGDYDDEITRCLLEDRVESGSTAENDSRPPDWEETSEEWKANAVANLKEKLQDYTRLASLNGSADVGLLTNIPFTLQVDTRNPIGPLDSPLERNNFELEPIVPHDESLVRHWNKLSLAFRQQGDNTIPDVEIIKVQLTKDVLGMLCDCLRVRDKVVLRYTNICGEGIKKLSTLIEQNPFQFDMELSHNPIVDVDAAICLSKALKANSFTKMRMIDCNIGENAEILTAILDADLQNLDLRNNNIGSTGAQRICEYLERNTSLRTLTLDNNNFQDEDAVLFAQALKKNTDLSLLALEKNKFTCVGVKSLIKGICDTSSLNTLSESNHKCLLRLLDLDGRMQFQDLQDFINTLQSLPRKRKIMMALHEKQSLLHYLSDIPVKIMPEVLGMINENEYHKRLNMLYATMRWWNMPSMYTFLCSKKNESKRKRDGD